MTLECPTCGSQEVRRASLAYEMGVQKTRNKTLGGGVALSMVGPIVGVGGAASRGRNTSLFAERFEPPKKVRPVLRAFLTFLAGIPLFGILEMIGVFTGVKFVMLLFDLIGLFCVYGLPFIVYFAAAKKNREIERQTQDWSRLFVCERCGEVFEPESFLKDGENRSEYREEIPL